MRTFLIASAVALAALTACATMPATAAPMQTIIYETGPCFGACPVYRITVTSDGNGTFEGQRFTAVTGVRRFRAASEQYRAFARHLEPLRPDHGTVRFAGEACATIATDLPSAEVTWRSAGGEQRLYFYYGCDMERNRAMAERLRAAPNQLPVGDLIGGRE